MLYDGDDLDSDNAIDERLREYQRELDRIQARVYARTNVDIRAPLDSASDNSELTEQRLERVPDASYDRREGPSGNRSTFAARHPSLPPSPVLGAREMNHETCWLRKSDIEPLPRCDDAMTIYDDYRECRDRLHAVNSERQRLRTRVSDLEQENAELMQTLELVNAKNKNLQLQLEIHYSDPADPRELELLKHTIAELEQQRLADEKVIASLEAKYAADCWALQSELDSLRNAAASAPKPSSSAGVIRKVPANPPTTGTPPIPPWATHEEISEVKNITPKPVVSVPIEISSVESSDTAAVPLESDLLKLNLEREALESQLGKLPSHSAGRTVAERKAKAEASLRLLTVERMLGDIKSKLKGRKSPNGA